MGAITNRLKAAFGPKASNVYKKVATGASGQQPSYTGALKPTVPYPSGTGVTATSKHFSDLSTLSTL